MPSRLATVTWTPRPCTGTRPRWAARCATARLDRGDVFITTKLLPGDAGRERAAIAASLRALGTSYVDLWLVHWPPDRRNLVRVWQELIAVRNDGLARAIGVSNYSIGQIDELVDATGERPSVNQIPYGLSRHDPKLLGAMRERGVIVEGYSPLKNANLRDPTLAEIAARHRVTPAQVVLRWHMQHGIPVIPKSGDPERITSNFAVFGFSLSNDDMAFLDGMVRPLTGGRGPGPAGEPLRGPPHPASGGRPLCRSPPTGGNLCPQAEAARSRYPQACAWTVLILRPSATVEVSRRHPRRGSSSHRRRRAARSQEDRYEPRWIA